MLLTELAAGKIKTHLEYHDTLNPKLWDKDMNLLPDVKEALKKISNSFLATLKVTPDQVIDIFITGSNANYNWSRLSDIDLHVTLDYEKVCKDCEQDKFDLDDCIKAKKTLWNDGHDVTIKGQDVEVYAQSSAETISGNAGIYSLVKDAWTRVPSKETDIEYDQNQIKKKAKVLMDKIDEYVKTGADEKAVKALQDKIKKMRQASISKGGEFSLENLVFKTLRNNGYMDKLYELGNKIKDNDLSLK
jgi:hypothetical protein